MITDVIIIIQDHIVNIYSLFIVNDIQRSYQKIIFKIITIKDHLVDICNLLIDKPADVCPSKTRVGTEVPPKTRAGNSLLDLFTGAGDK